MFVIGDCDKNKIKKISKNYNLDINIKEYSKDIFEKEFSNDILIKEVLENHIVIKGFECFIEFIWKKSNGV